MPNQQTDFLVQLIRSMTKAEKRNFKLYANRINAGDMKFLQLFDAIDKQRDYNEEVILNKLPNIKRAQISNMKAHLYKQLLISLRLQHTGDNVDIQVRERLDYARVLYNKGLYLQTLKVLDKTKQMAMEAKQSILTLEVVEFEKLIESQYITRSMGSRAEELTEEVTELNRLIDTAQRLSNLALRLYGLYLKVGYTRSEKDYLMVKEFFASNLPPYEVSKLSFYEKLYLCQAYVWYNYMIQDFLMCYRYAQKWVDLFRSEPEMILQQPDLYVKGMHNLLAALFNIMHHSRFVTVLNELEEFAQHHEELKFTENTKLQLFIYVYHNKINQHFIEGRFTEGLQLVPIIEEGLEHYGARIDSHRLLVFWYKIGCLYFGSGDNRNAIRYLNKVINYRDTNLREDIHCFARILNLIAHYELGNDDLVQYQVKSVYRFLAKMEDIQKVQEAIFNFLRRMPNVYPHEMRDEFIKLRRTLGKLMENPFEKRPFLYLDIISWLDCKIDNRPVQDVIREKHGMRRKGSAGG